MTELYEFIVKESATYAMPKGNMTFTLSDITGRNQLISEPNGGGSIGWCNRILPIWLANMTGCWVFTQEPLLEGVFSGLISSIYSRFKELGEEVTTDLHYRFEKSEILQVFPELSFNPFVDRIFHVFSSLKDGKMSFEDVLDLASVFSEECPIDVKAQWAFLMYDFDGDQLLNQDDIAEIVTRLTKSPENVSEGASHCLSDAETKKAAEIIFNDIVLCHSEGITCVEFINEVKKNPEFECSFRIKFL